MVFGRVWPKSVDDMVVQRMSRVFEVYFMGFAASDLDWRPIVQFSTVWAQTRLTNGLKAFTKTHVLKTGIWAIEGP